MSEDPPRTMTLSGLRFLRELAAQRKSGCYLELGPLFGSSTCAIAAGRGTQDATIHTIDTFEPAPWIRRRHGIDLSVEAFESFTQDIEKLKVYQGFAPDVVRGSWTEPVGFYFDDATHGNPGWQANYDFFSPYFTGDAIICGDDFAGGWPDVVRNVYDITAAAEASLFVIGRVWAFTFGDPDRISAAVHAAFPKLRGFDVTVRHCGAARRNIAASWSWGLHRAAPLTEFELHAPDGFAVGATIDRADGTFQTAVLGREAINLEGATGLTLALPGQFGVQFCMLAPNGKTQNTKELRSIRLPAGHKLTAIRLTHS